MITQPIYLLYDGQSEDGRGQAKFKCATFEIEEAKTHLWYRDSPYSLAHVDLIKGSTISRFFKHKELKCI